jgi:hypothetical protein
MTNIQENSRTPQMIWAGNLTKGDRFRNFGKRWTVMQVQPHEIVALSDCNMQAKFAKNQRFLAE